MAEFGTHTEEDLPILDAKLKQLRNEYEQYFLGSRKREPHMLRLEVNRMVTHYANVRIQNTAQRFKYNNLRARYSSLKRHWDLTLRKIEEGRYERHLFKARIHENERLARPDPPPAKAVRAAGGADLFESYRSAREACGQGTEGLTQDKLQSLVARQEFQIREKFGCRSVQFRVVVEDGKAKLKARPVR
jgi:hypothetical protein